MNYKTIFSLAWAETRKSHGKLLFCVFSIAVGVGSLTAVRTAILSLEHSIASQARNLMGADLLIQSSRGLEESLMRDLGAELKAAGAENAHLTEFYSMLYRRAADRPGGLAAGTGRVPAQSRTTRLVRIRAVSGNYPMYGEIQSEPAGVWKRLAAGSEPVLLADPVLLSTLDMKAGDRVFLGDMAFRLGGAFLKTEGSPASGFGFAPAVYIHETWLDETGLIQLGSRIRYFSLFRVPAEFDAEGWKNDNFERAVAGNLQIQSFREGAASIQRFLSRLSHFLTVVGLITLLLGGLGIGSAMAVFIKAKLDHAAILRSLGARPGQVFRIYLALAMVLGLLGSLLGVIPGSILPVLASQFAASELGGDLLPVALDIRFSYLAAFQGIAAGVIATFLFTLFPVYSARRVSPLRILRKSETEEEQADVADAAARGAGTAGFSARFMRVARVLMPGITPADLPVYLGGLVLIFAFILLVTVTQTNSIQMALYFTGAVAGSLLLLGLVSRLVTVATRLFIPYIKSYHIRQGVANLYRPGNQTAAVITAIGVGMLLVASIYIMEESVQSQISVESREDLPNLFLVDMQPSQLPGVKAMLAREEVEDLMIAPMVSSRVRALNGKPIEKTGLERNAVERTWQDRMRTREYFLTYRDALIDSEEVVAGEFWTGRPAEQQASVDEGWAKEMQVELGDVVTLDVQGVEINAAITSIRRVRWQAMKPNSLLVLSPGVIERAPPVYVASFRIPDPERIFAFQEKLVRTFPNLSIIDVTEAVNNVRFILGRISIVIRFLAAITLLNGIIILGGAIAAGRFARLRESMLLKVLGASRKDLSKILLSEYGILALLGCLAGWLLAELVNRPALTIFFQSTPVVPYSSILLILAGIVALNVGVGFLISRDVASSKPLAVLRDE